MEIFNIPSHFRFKNEKEAKFSNRTTEDWIPISNIRICDDKNIEISSPSSVLWVSYNRVKDNLEFKCSKFNKKDLIEFESE